MVGMSVDNYTLSSMARYIFFFNDTATTEIYTLSLHDALPISRYTAAVNRLMSQPNKTATVSSILGGAAPFEMTRKEAGLDRKSTRLNSSHPNIPYAVFCLTKKQTAPAGARQWPPAPPGSPSPP